VCRHGVRTPGAQKFLSWLTVWTMRCGELG
jgi:hypothetical protein